MVMNNTSTVDTSIQAVSPVLSVGAATGVSASAVSGSARTVSAASRVRAGRFMKVSGQVFELLPGDDGLIAHADHVSIWAPRGQRHESSRGGKELPTGCGSVTRRPSSGSRGETAGVHRRNAP